MEARLHCQMHFARFSDVAAAAMIPCSEFVAATVYRRLSLRTSEIAYAGAEWERAGCASAALRSRYCAQGE